MKRSTIILIICCPFILLGQFKNDSLLSSFYNRTLTSYFSASNYTSQQQFDEIIIRTDYDTSQLIKSVKGYTFKYFDYQTSIHSILEKPLKNNKGRIFYMMRYNVLHPDTVDILLNDAEIKTISRLKTSILSGKNGRGEYIPNGRFIYDRDKDEWKFISRKEIQASKAQQFENIDK